MTAYIGPESEKLASMLAGLKGRSGRGLKGIAAQVETSMPTLSRMFTGAGLPGWDVVWRCVRALSPEEPDQVIWLDLYERAKAERDAWKSARALRVAWQRPEGQSWEQSLVEVNDLSGLQQRLRALMAEADVSMRQVGFRAMLTASTVSDHVNAPTPPRPSTVGLIVRACGADPGPWVDAAVRLRLPVPLPSLSRQHEAPVNGGGGEPPASSPERTEPPTDELAHPQAGHPALSATLAGIAITLLVMAITIYFTAQI